MTADNNKNKNIHPMAIVEPGAVVGENVCIEAFAVIGKHVELKSGVTIKSHAVIDGHTTIGENSIVYPFACIGTKTQDRKYKGEITYVRIGKDCEIREYATINSSCGEGTSVVVEDGCLIMAYCHIAHNCHVGKNVIMSNNATLAGHVTVGDHAIIGGMTPVHQFCRIGAYAMVGGLSRVTHDIPPYTIGYGTTVYKFGGLNMVGLKRRGFSLETRSELSKAFKLTYRSGLHIDEALHRIETELKMIPEVRNWLDFCKSTQRGLSGLQGVAQLSEDSFDSAEEEEVVSAM